MSALALAVALAALPWEGEAFAGDPAAIAAAAARLEPGADGAEVDVLLEEFTLELDEAGRASSSVRLVFVPRTAAAVRGWAATQASYSPWYQERPEIRARVVSAAGEARWLDPSTLVEGAVAGEEGQEVFSDRRTLRGPLPGVEPGAVVEERVALRDREPFFAGGGITYLPAMRPVPVRRFTARVSAPASLPLRWQASELPGPAERVEGGRRLLLWQASPLPAALAPEPFRPPDAPGYRRIALSTARSWREVAGAYAALAERQLAGASLATTARTLLSPGDGPEESSQKVLDWIAARVRYTGLSLGERAIVPARPAETLARGYGDCKDLSLLAVGLLRAAGHEASVALVATGGADPVPDLPGLAFDHAVVRVGGRRPIWFDPTDPGTPAGALPPWLQGRLALSARPDAAALERTPESGAGANGWSKVRRIELRESGWARGSEAGVFRGTAAADVRRLLVPLGGAEAERAARARMSATDGTAVSLRSEPGPGRGAPARATFEAEDTRWGNTGDDEAVALLVPHPVFQRLPAYFRTEVLEAGDEEEPPPPRRGALLLGEAYTAELRYEVVPPPGFRAGALPRDEKVRMGPASLEGSFSAAPDGTVVATWRFTVDRRRLEPGEVDALWRGVADRTRLDQPRVRFRRLSDDLLAEGKGREALAEISRLVALHPTEARHRCHLSLALLGLGLGAEARAEARRALALEPEAEWPHRVLAHALHHDLLGRPFGRDADLAGAVAAQRRALELAPKSPLVRAQLARLLEQGDAERYGPGARLEEALAVRRGIRGELRSDEGLADLAALLLVLGRPAEALEAARAAPPAAERNAVLLAAAGAAEGGGALMREAAALPSGDRGPATQGALLRLLGVRRYDVVAALVERGRAAGSGDGEADAFASLVARLKPSCAAPDRADPAALPLRLFQAALAADPEQGVLALAARRAGDPAELLRGGSATHLVPAALGAAFPRAALVDVLAALIEVRVEGDGPPWRVHCTMPGVSEQGAFTLLAVREEGEARLAFGDPNARQYAAAALRAAQGGDLPAARRLLGWALAGKGGSAEDGARAIWRSGPEAGREELELAAYALAGPGTPDEARALLPRLEAERARATGQARLGLLLAALEGALRASDYPRAQALADELATQGGPARAIALDARRRALLDQGKLAEARAAAEARLADQGDDRFALQMLPRIAALQGDAEAAAAAHRRLLAGQGVTASDLNEAAWNELFRARPGAEALEWARKGAAQGSRGHAAMHTLATVHAWQGRPGEALGSLRGAVDLRGGMLRAEDWLVVGRIAEEYGLTGAAAEAYRMVAPPGRASAMSSYELARRRLALLGASGAR